MIRPFRMLDDIVSELDRNSLDGDVRVSPEDFEEFQRLSDLLCAQKLDATDIELSLDGIDFERAKTMFIALAQVDLHLFGKAMRYVASWRSFVKNSGLSVDTGWV